MCPSTAGVGLRFAYPEPVTWIETRDRYLWHLDRCMERKGWSVVRNIWAWPLVYRERD